MNWSHFLIAIRWQNVLIVWLMQSVIYFRYILIDCGRENYSFISYLLFLIATGSVLAAGNIYNDIKDVPTDSIHPDKPALIGKEITLSKAWRWVLTLSLITFVCCITGWWKFSWPLLLIFMFLTGMLCLYVYSNWLKTTILLGNVLVGLLCALSVWMTTLLATGCDLGFQLLSQNRIPLIISGYIVNAFLVNVLREIVKDKEDAFADMKVGIFTVGSLSEIRFRWIFNGLVAVLVAFNATWFYMLRKVLSFPNWNLGILMIFIPLALIALLYNLPHRPNIYSFLSKLIKVYILFSILLLILWQRG